LTRGNQGHIDIIAAVSARAGKWQRVLLAATQSTRTVSNYRTCLSHFRNLLTFEKGRTSGKSRANQHHRESRAKPGRRNLPRAFCWSFRTGRRPDNGVNENNITSKRHEEQLHEALQSSRR
jgi:hypothetical protein